MPESHQSQSIYAYQSKRRLNEQDEDHREVIDMELINIEDGNKPPDHCDYCGQYWPCPWAVSKELL